MPLRANIDPSKAFAKEGSRNVPQPRAGLPLGQREQKMGLITPTGDQPDTVQTAGINGMGSYDWRKRYNGEPGSER